MEREGSPRVGGMTGPDPGVTAVLALFLTPLIASLGPLISKAFIPAAPSRKESALAEPLTTVCVLSAVLIPSAALALLYNLVRGDGRILLELGLPSPLAIPYIMDGPAWLACALISLVALCSAVYGLAYGGLSPGFWFFYLIALAALYSCVLSDDLFNLFVSLELLALSSYVLIAYKRTPSALWASYSYLITSTVAVVFYLLGLYLVYGYVGTLSLTAARDAIRALGPEPPRDLRLALCFLSVALGVRGAYAPFHAWLPEAHASAPHPVSALLSGASLAAGYFALARLLGLLEAPSLLMGLRIAGTATALAGGMFAVAQRNAKRLLAWSSVGHAGLCVAALASGFFEAGALHAVSHGAAKALLFLCIGTLSDSVGSREISRLRGRAGFGTSLGIILGVASLAGLPPLAGAATKSLAGYSAGSGGAAYRLALNFAAVLSAAAVFRLLPVIGLFAARSAKPGQRFAPRLRTAAAALGILPLAGICLLGASAAVLNSASNLLGAGIHPASGMLASFGEASVMKPLLTLAAGAGTALLAETRPGTTILGLWERRGTGADAALRLVLAGAAAAALLEILQVA